MIRTILRMGDPRLLVRSAEVTQFDTPQLHALVSDLFDTMRHTQGVGLAAPQIGVAWRVVVFGCQYSTRYPAAPPVPDTILINPVLTPMDDQIEEDWEGCLSVPGLRGMVPRYARLHYSGFDLFGKKFEREVAGFHARVVQHECDHLDGVLYPMRVQDFSRFGFNDALFGGQAMAVE